MFHTACLPTRDRVSNSHDLCSPFAFCSPPPPRQLDYTQITLTCSGLTLHTSLHPSDTLFDWTVVVWSGGGVRDVPNSTTTTAAAVPCPSVSIYNWPRRPWSMRMNGWTTILGAAASAADPCGLLVLLINKSRVRQDH